VALAFISTSIQKMGEKASSMRTRKSRWALPWEGSCSAGHCPRWRVIAALDKSYSKKVLTAAQNAFLGEVRSPTYSHL
jgi:hypothetical protein